VRARKCLVLAVILAACGCGGSKEKTTPELIVDLNSRQEKDRIIAVRTLPKRKDDAARVVPALIEALKDDESDVRWSAAIGLGYFGAQAKDAIPALKRAQSDKDARVREGATVALSRIDPASFPPPSKQSGK
jgi:HEAT repeat protein